MVMYLQYFRGNSDRNTIVSHPVSPAIRCRTVRIRPWGWRSHISMRVEFLGCLTGMYGFDWSCSGFLPGPVVKHWSRNHYSQNSNTSRWCHELLLLLFSCSSPSLLFLRSWNYFPRPRGSCCYRGRVALPCGIGLPWYICATHIS